MLEIFDKRSTRLLAFLSLFTAYCISLVVLRYVWTGKASFGFLIWNLFLAWMPIVFSSVAQFFARKNILFISAAFLIPWLLFLPNAPYILTDLVHLRPRTAVPYWYDILLMASFAINGLLLGFFSLAQIHQLLADRLRPPYAWAAILLFSVGSSYGIYLGRVQRWNSWDILRHPMRIAVDCLRPLIHPYSHKEAIVMTAVLSGLFFVGYLVFQGFGGRMEDRQIVDRK